MKLDLRTGRGRRASVVAAAGGAALTLLAGAGVAHASVETVDSIGVVGDGRLWDFQNGNTSGFGISDGLLAKSRYSTDAFDGGLVLYVDGIPFYDTDDLGAYNSSKQTMSVGPETMGSLQVSRTEQAKGPYVRSLVRLKNTSGSTAKTSLRWYSDLGSDGSGVVNSSSSGKNGKLETSDRWFVTHAPEDTGYDDDPTVAFVLFGKKAPATSSEILQKPPSGYVDVELTVKVAPGKTRYLMFYTEMHSTPEQAKKSMAKYDKQGLSSSLLSGISKKVRGNIVNWKL